MKRFIKILFSSSVALMVFMGSFVPALGSPGDGEYEPTSIKLEKKL